MTSRSQAFWPYKIACILLYGWVEGVEHLSPEEIIVETGRLSDHLGIPNTRLRDYLMQLQELEILSDVDLRHGYARLKMAAPRGWQPRETGNG